MLVQSEFSEWKKFERRLNMPYITIESGALSDEQKEELIKRLTEVSVEVGYVFRHWVFKE